MSRMRAAASGIAAALPLCIYLWSFMVDDALISARYAAHLWAGHGYRFNIGGPVTDGVTPLGWALLLAPFSAGDVLTAFHAAKIVGLVSWLVGAALIGVAIDALELPPRKWLALGLLACLAPLGAWSVAGMETGLVLGLAAAAVSARALGREAPALLACGVVGALRPEALPWALALALAPSPSPSPFGRWRALAIAALPFVSTCAVRLMAFGRIAPLSLYAKPSDLSNGALYSAASAILTGVVALAAWRGLPPWVRGLQAATLVHFGAIAVAGGDWMPLSRLAVVALPGMLIAAAYATGSDRRAVALPRLGLAIAGALYALVTVGPRASSVGPKRLAVIDALRPHLADAKVVGALDVGWVGAACEATIVDFAGVTDPAVAGLTGGHTSKRVGRPLLDARQVDTLVLHIQGPLADPWTESQFVRWVEWYVADLPSMKEDFTVVTVNEDGPDGTPRYVVLRRRGGDS